MLNSRVSKFPDRGNRVPGGTDERRFRLLTDSSAVTPACCATLLTEGEGVPDVDEAGDYLIDDAAISGGDETNDLPILRGPELRPAFVLDSCPTFNWSGEDMA